MEAPNTQKCQHERPALQTRLARVAKKSPESPTPGGRIDAKPPTGPSWPSSQNRNSGKSRTVELRRRGAMFDLPRWSGARVALLGLLICVCHHYGHGPTAKCYQMGFGWTAGPGLPGWA